MLIIFGGLPGTGKSTIARELAKRIQAMYLRIDTIEQAMRSSNVLIDDVGPAGYVAAYNVALDNLRIGLTIVADSVNPIEITRSDWRAVADQASAPFIEVELICSDVEEHRKRVETRPAEVPGLVLPTWQYVVERDYEEWHAPHIVLDTFQLSIQESVNKLVHAVSAHRSIPAETH